MTGSRMKVLTGIRSPYLSRKKMLPGYQPLLEQLRPRAKEMGERARAEWEKWFAEDVRFHQVAELCLDMQMHRKTYGKLHRMYHLRHVVASRSDFWRYMISKKRLYKEHRRIFW